MWPDLLGEGRTNPRTGETTAPKRLGAGQAGPEWNRRVRSVVAQVFQPDVSLESVAYACAVAFAGALRLGGNGELARDRRESGPAPL
jgi:hypothetical protein